MEPKDSIEIGFKFGGLAAGLLPFFSTLTVVILGWAVASPSFSHIEPFSGARWLIASIYIAFAFAICVTYYRLTQRTAAAFALAKEIAQKDGNTTLTESKNFAKVIGVFPLWVMKLIVPTVVLLVSFFILWYSGDASSSEPTTARG